MTGSHPKTHLASSKGMTIIELMTVMVIIGLLAAIALPKYQGFLEQARMARCIAEIRYLDRDIQAYLIANEEYPETLGDMHLSISNMLDPWGNPYQYLLIAPKGKGKKASNGGGGGIYYALSGMNDGTFYTRNLWRLDFVATGVAVDGNEGSWSGSWFVSEAYAAAGGNSGDPGNSGNAGGGNAGGNSGDPGNSGNAGGGNAGGNSGNAGGGNAGGNSGNAGGGNAGGNAQPRKDRFLVPINSDYDLYSMGVDGKSTAPLTVKVSHDDIIRAANGVYVGLAANF